MHVGGIALQKTAYLTLDELATDPRLARRLPPDLAWRCHALPLAEDNGRVTVAMADPDDVKAREAVVSVLGATSCVVRGSAFAIDTRLAEIWGDRVRQSLRVKVCTLPDPPPEELKRYTQALGNLLGAQPGQVNTEEEADTLVSRNGKGGCDLVIFGKRRHPLVRRLLSQSPTDGTLASQRNVAPFAVLIARQPRWPLERILLAIRGEGADTAAVDWALRLAQPSTAEVTVLAVVPPVPTMYRGLARMEQSVAALLTTDTALGRQMHHVAERLAACKVDGTLRLRQGAPDQEICREALEGNHDLIAMATNPCQWWLRQLKGDPICSLLSRVDRPMLFAEPAAA
ncbi:MAG: universal stress protein [Anaerolineae bacterium]|jgi:nucleotide-binding universal stress UspA family protein